MTSLIAKPTAETLAAAMAAQRAHAQRCLAYRLARVGIRIPVQVNPLAKKVLHHGK